MTYLSRSITAFLLPVLISSGLCAQTSFQKIYVDSLNNYARRFFELPDSGYIVAGAAYTTNNTLDVPWLMRLDKQGEVVWRKTYPMPVFGSFEYVIPAADGGYLGVGHTSEFNGSLQRILVIKTDGAGNFQWSTILDDTWQCADVKAVPDGYLLCGTLYHFTIGDIDGILVKIDLSGEVVWSKNYGDNVDGKRVDFSGIAVLGDTIYLSGAYQSKLAFFSVAATEGELYSAQYYPDTSTGFSGLEIIRLSDDGGFMIGGNANLTGTNLTASTLYKISKNGTMTMAKAFYRQNGAIVTYSMDKTSDGGFILGCFFSPAPSDQRSLLIKTDSAGGINAAFQYIKTSLSLNYTLPAADGGFTSLRRSVPAGYMVLTKTLPDMLVDGCCTAPLTIKTLNLPTTRQALNLLAEDFGQPTQNFSLPTVPLALISTPYCPPEPLLLDQTLSFCPGDSVLVAGNWYAQPGTVTDTILSPTACDTITTYSLQWLPLLEKTEVIEFCPGESVSIGGVVYTEPTIVTDTLVVDGACDTIVTYLLNWLPQPATTTHLEFCPGASVNIGGVTYDQPGTVVDTLPATVGCDTIATYILAFTSLPQPSAPAILCPPSVTVDAQAGQPSAPASYAFPTATTDCPCGDAAISLVEGLPSGSDFPVGVNTVCYQANDECGNSASCCFTVTVEVPADETPCDVKTTPCIRFEVLGIFQNPAGQKTYRMRVTNTCANRLVYAVFQLPEGLTADAPSTNTTYTAPSGRGYAVRNANASPFYSIRFKSAAAGISGGQSEVFEYTLPPQAAPVFIHAAARLEGQGLYETHLNVFDCVVQQTADRPSQAGAREDWSSPGGGNFTVSPNPFTDQLDVAFDLEEAGAVQAVLSDMTGRVVFLENKNLPAAGRQNFAWNTGDLPNGAYLVGVKLPGLGWAYRKVVLLR